MSMTSWSRRSNDQPKADQRRCSNFIANPAETLRWGLLAGWLRLISDLTKLTARSRAQHSTAQRSTAEHITAIPEKLTVPQLVKKFLAFCGKRRFITAITTARHLSISWGRSMQSMSISPSHVLRIHFILSSHLHAGLPSGLLPSDLSIKIMYTPLSSPYLLHALRILFFFI